MAAPRRKPTADRTHHGAVAASSIDESSSAYSSNDQAPIHRHQLGQTPLPTTNVLKLLWLLVPPLLLATGLSIFTQSFFLSRTSFDHRSSCGVGSAGDLLKDSLGLNEDHVEFLRRSGFLSDGKKSTTTSATIDNNYGCWVPRRVDSMAILVVDALRFDFARDHLPLSVGSRLFPSRNATHLGTSKLYQFVADPPTVTMQRLKGLTTGGLPTFADISGSFGGASIEEDSWVEQLKDVPWDRRRHHSLDESKPRMAFVGDDTWVDLFPTQFDDCHPFPSFNTRDLNTVDNGCLEHLPRLLDGLVGLKQQKKMMQQDHIDIDASSFELIVAHFLGVDHVGHTYGPNNPHMEKKLHQMDVMLSTTLNSIDNAPQDSCIVALVLGDHGMTEDGNHGGGTSEEVNAGLFVHFSPGCNNSEHDDGVTGEEIPGSARAFDSIHQIDLVPTVSFLMGLPIPYANIGGLVPDLLPTPRYDTPQFTSFTTPHTATALALNAAQVWNYLHTYSQTSRDLPLNRLRELKALLDSAALVYRDAIAYSQKHTSNDEQHFFDSTAYRQAFGLFNLFLAESTDLGKQVWTQFNEGGMMIGIGILVLAWIMATPLWKRSVRNEFGAIGFLTKSADVNGSIKENVKGSDECFNSSVRSFRALELLTALIFMIFQCGVLTFGNSYIEHEREIVTFFLSILCLLVFRRWYFTSGTHSPTSVATSTGSNSVYLPLIVALCSRMNDVFVTGHGLDPSIRLHATHHPIVFLSSLLVLLLLRLRWLSPMSKSVGTGGILPVFIDIMVIICLACSWWEKHSLDDSRNGFSMARFSMMAVFVGLMQSLFSLSQHWKSPKRGIWIEQAQLASFRVMLFLVIVTGPSTASTAVLIVIQCAALRFMMQSVGARQVAAPVMAAIWRLAIRHVFFATNHHCSFNRLQYSAAFVATDTFHFSIAGSSLFMNTFGWEVLGSILVLVNTRASCSPKNGIGSHVWDWFRYFQWTEMLASCISVSVMKRHLMVWAIFAPRFMFAAVFTAVGLLLWVLDVILMELLVVEYKNSYE
ncbi:hypothetical protein ACHAXR_011121 [Thalassiosira sp. AJA248-18]